MKTDKLLALFIFLFLMLVPCSAQKKEIAAAQELLKQGKDFAKVEQSMTTLLKDSSNRQNEKIWSLLFESLRKQYDQGNEKLYLKQKYDTASLFDIASRMFTVMESYDSIESQPDKKGRIKLKYRKENASTLNTLRPNLYNGGAFFIKKQDYSTAYHLFDQYIDAADQPLFKSYDYGAKDKSIPKAAYWAAYCGYKLKDTKKVLHHTYLALKDTAHNENMLQYLAATYQLEGDTARFINTLRDGFDQYPLSSFFFPHLIRIYSQQGKWKEALALTNKALAADSANVVFLLTKSSVLLFTGDYEDSFDICDKIIKRNGQKDSVPDEAYLNAGLAKFNQGVTLDKNVQILRKNRNKILEYYKAALPYLEKYRELKPDDKDKWALPLYTIYLNLNMGNKFDDIDKILKKG